eukprot:8620747-Pyramimonas_sp.AAC.2
MVRFRDGAGAAARRELRGAVLRGARGSAASAAGRALQLGTGGATHRAQAEGQLLFVRPPEEGGLRAMAGAAAACSPFGPAGCGRSALAGERETYLGHRSATLFRVVDRSVPRHRVGSVSDGTDGRRRWGV